MTRKISDYRNIIGEKAIDRIEKKASSLSEKHLVHVNSTYYGGGVAEILSSLVILLNDVGISTGWRLLKGNADFFSVTKKFHNALQGENINLTTRKKKLYVDVNKENSVFTHITDHDMVIIHDPQPLPLIKFYKKSVPWLWRCHVDLSNPNTTIWNYLKQFIVNYDSMIVSANKFKHDLPIPQKVIAPSIDPLSSKNIELKESVISKTLEKYNIPTDKPIISQISRFDKWKDPWGVIDAYRMARQKVDCRLVLLGEFSNDDPEGQMIYDGIIGKKGEDDDIIVINQTNSVLANALQTTSTAVLQKSTKEGFGLTVSEALWKRTPVIGGNVGGIPLQIINGKNGYLVNSVSQCASRIVKLVKDPKLASKMGKNGRKHVSEKFLITRHLENYVDLFNNALS